MKATILHEPELEFGLGRHIDIRFGLMNHGPLDYDSPLAPKAIRLGIVGTNQTIEGISRWLERCQNSIPAKVSNKPNLFPRFPGFNPDVGFRATLLTDARLLRTIPQAALDQLKQYTTFNQLVSAAVELFLVELRYLAQDTLADVLICALPLPLLTLMNQLGSGEMPQVEEVEDEDERESIRFDFHDLLKARALALRKPTQIVLPMTYDETIRLQQKTRPDRIKRLQDEATRAWNFHTALYYKAGGKPWRLLRDPSDYTTCYVGVSFYRTLDEQQLHTSVAQVFNERGDGVVVRGAVAQIKDDRRPHLDAEGAYRLLNDALDRYREEHRTLPARVAVHKTSTHNDEEVEGFVRAARSQRVEFVDLLSLHKPFIRAFRTGAYPPLRGTLIALDGTNQLLYTRGSVDFFETYPGLYVPRALGFRCDHVEQTPAFLARELLGLTKMNWNQTQFDGSDPITVWASRQVSSILKYVAGGEIPARYAFYM
jgi:hypothetical protein